MYRYFFLIILIIIFSFISCKQAVQVKLSGKAQGTTYSVSYYDKNGANYQPEIDSLLNAFNKTASLYDTTSIISKVNKNIPVEIYSDFSELFNRSLKISTETDGAFDFTVRPLVKAFKFDSKDQNLINEKRIDSILKFVGYKKVKISDNRIIKDDLRAMLDFNAIAQGYSVDKVALLLEGKGIENYFVEIGGEVFARGKKEDGSNWIVGIDKPLSDNNTHELQAKARLENRALATSGNYRKFFKHNGVRYSHIIDPRTGYPVTNLLLSASVFASNCADADAYATTFMVFGLEKTREFLEKHKELDAFLIYSDSLKNIKTYHTDGLLKVLFDIK
jgi:FAD:protein FMN transferase